MKKILIAAIAGILIFCGPSYANDKTRSENSTEAHFNVAAIFASCSGAYAAMEDIMGALVTEKAATFLGDLSRGAHTAGAVTIWTADTTKSFNAAADYISDIAEAEKHRWMGLAKLEAASPQNNIIPPTLQERIDYCQQTDIQELQVAAIDLVRRLAYEASGQTE